VEVVNVFANSGLVVFDREEVVSFLFLHDVTRGLLLGVHGVGCNHTALNVEIAKQGFHAGNLVGLSRNGSLSDHDTAAMNNRAEQVQPDPTKPD